MESSGRTLWKSGLILFILGLALGFVLQAFPDPRAALSAHLNAVQSGTFLIALGLLWPKLFVRRNLSAPLAHTIWIAFLGLEAGMVLKAFEPPGEAAPAALKAIATALQGLSAVAMFSAVTALLFTFRRSAAHAVPVTKAE